MISGYKINEYIKKTKITQEKMAEVAGLTKPTISKMINKRTCDLRSLIAVANVMEVTLDYLCDRNLESNPNISINGSKNQFGNGNVMVESQAHEIEHLKKIIEEKVGNHGVRQMTTVGYMPGERNINKCQHKDSRKALHFHI